MRKIAIIGAGQGGLHIGIGLLEQGYDVSIFSDRSADELRDSKLMASPILFQSTLQMERDLGLNFWEDQAPWAEGAHIDFRSPDGEIQMTLQGELDDNKAQAVDLRYKYPRWMEEFEKRGGKLIIKSVTVDDIDSMAGDFDLIMVAAGKGEMTQYFERDDERSVYTKPPRMLAAMLVRGPGAIGKQPWAHIPFRPLRFNIIDEVGGLFSLPFYSDQGGECRSLMFEALPGSGMDVFSWEDSSEEILAKAKQVIKKFIPDDYSHFVDAELIDDKAWLAGSYVPVVRKPVGKLPSGNKVMLVGDTVVLNDPYAGQGANNASRMANIVIKRIVDHGTQAFDDEWITDTFEEFWETNGRYATEFTNTLMDNPLPGMLEFVGAASQNQHLASIFFQNFGDPAKFWPWIEDAEAAKQFIAQQMTTA